MASLRGRVVEFYTGRGVSGALVTLGVTQAVTDVNGYFTVMAPPGIWQLQVIHKSFRPFATSFNLSQNIAYSLQAPIRIQSVVRAL